MQVIRIQTLGDLTGLQKWLKEQGATNKTPIFASSDPEGNGYARGIEIGYDGDASFTGFRSNQNVSGGAVIAYPFEEGYDYE